MSAGTLDAGTIAVAVLLALGLAGGLIAVIGLAAVAGVPSKLHVVGFAGYAVAVPVVAAIVVAWPSTQFVLKAVLVLLAALGSGPLLLHAMGHAWWLQDRRRGKETGR